ncbi:MAG: hypothetical protein LBE62_01085, partial [Azonexus sp.]|nr:hypothetical protein [Azonexus sp.]
PPDVGKWLPGYALHLFPHIGQSGQFMCYKTGQIYLLPTCAYPYEYKQHLWQRDGVRIRSAERRVIGMPMSLTQEQAQPERGGCYFQDGFSDW